MAKLFDGCRWPVGFEEIVSIADCHIGTLVLRPSYQNGASASFPNLVKGSQTAIDHNHKVEE
jgi:hypothetical protein